MRHADARVELGRHWILPSPLAGVPHFRLKQGPITIARFDGDTGRYQLAVGEGHSIDGPHNGAIVPLLRGVGDVLRSPHVEPVDERLCLLVGDLALGRFEDDLSQQWPLCLDGNERAFRVVSALWRVMQRAAEESRSDAILIDLGPNLGAINRAALVASDYLVVPLTPDLFSLQGLKNLGPTVRVWRAEWKDRVQRSRVSDLVLPQGLIKPIGYVVMQHAVRLNRPVKAYERWAARIPSVYAEEMLGQDAGSMAGGENCLGLVKHYRSMMPMVQEARKPMFHLTAADGAIGAHASAVIDARRNFGELAAEISKHCGVMLPTA